MSQDEEFDWFDKDEEDMVNDLKAKQITDSVVFTEHITSANTDFSSMVDHLESMPDSCFSKKTVTTSKLREIAKMSQLDAFLYVSTLETDFFTDQIVPNDSMERVLLFVQIVVGIASLELPGYYVSMLKSFVNNAPLLQHFHNISSKLFNKKYKSMWTDVTKVDEIVGNMEALFLRSHQEGLMSENSRAVLQQIGNIIEKSDFPTHSKHKTCIDFYENINHIMSSDAVKSSKNADEIYPSLDELLAEEVDETTKSSQLTRDYHSTNEYIDAQKYLLREDFMISMRDCVRSLKATQKPNSPSTVFFEDVHIVLNEEFQQANPNEMVFVDILGGQRTVEDKKNIAAVLRKELHTIKTGSLLCFSTSYDFENLILATVRHIDIKLLSAGYISIGVVGQYNIGTIYDRKLMMFQSPAFFEPYHNVFNVIKSYGAHNMPMKKYIVNGEVNSTAPAYLQESTTYTHNGIPFKPLTEIAQNLPLNESQALAYKSALSQEFCLIQGPPGTGKTFLSVEIVKTLIQNAKTPIVLVTYTNESLDKFLLKLSASTDSIARFGSQSKHQSLDKFNISNFEEAEQLNPLVKRLYFVTKLHYKEKFEALQKQYQEFDGTDESYELIVLAQRRLSVILTKLNTIRVLFQYYLVKEKRIIALTTTCAAKTNYLFKLLQSSIVVFEEAAEILESHVIACLTRYTQHVIMVGDHMQLQPYTSSFQHSRIHEMNVSLFERLINRNFKNTMLATQYRMRPEIADLICPSIYENLKNAPAVNDYPNVKNMQKNLFFLSHDQMESEIEFLPCSKYNLYECKEVIQLAKHLLSNQAYSPKNIVILSPYAKQIELILKELQTNSDLSAIKASTVDSYQGLEADIILLSLVRSNNNGDIGFLKEKNRICVALSRAKAGLFIIGNMRLLSQCSETWKNIENKLIAHDAIGSAFPYAV